MFLAFAPRFDAGRPPVEPAPPAEEDAIGDAEHWHRLAKVRDRILTKERLVRDVRAGRLSLSRAVALLRELDAADPPVDPELLRRHVAAWEASFPLPVRSHTAPADWTEEEVYWRWLLHLVRGASDASEAAQRLCAAFDARFAGGGAGA
jgi:hypothetical protein